MTWVLIAASNDGSLPRVGEEVFVTEHDIEGSWSVQVRGDGRYYNAVCAPPAGPHRDDYGQHGASGFVQQVSGTTVYGPDGKKHLGAQITFAA